MVQDSSNPLTDLRGVGNLTIDAINGVVNMVESLHSTIAGASDSTAEQKRLDGIPGLVYRNIRTVTGLVGLGIDLPLKHLGSYLGEKESPPAREAVIAALNGYAGDHLAATDNPLAIHMRLCRDGKTLNEEEIAAAIQLSNSKVALMIHGAFMNDRQWHRQGHDHGAALARDLAFTPLYLNYNTGLHISENGRLLADLLQKAFAQAQQPFELAIIAHSMGGLVARSACHYAQEAGHSWLNYLQKILFLGTPHHGALLEKGGNWINAVMDTSPYSAPFARLGKMRSSGITDLRHGTIRDEDWQGRGRFDLTGDPRTPTPLPEGVSCYAIAATKSPNVVQLKDEILGDGLVPLSSALGRHAQPELDLAIPENRQWIGRNMNHLDLLSHPDVYQVIKSQLAPL